MSTPNAPAFLRALADLLERHQATLGYSNEDRGVEIDVAGVEVAAIWCIDTASGAAELRAAAAGLDVGPPPSVNPFSRMTGMTDREAEVSAALDAHITSVKWRWPMQTVKINAMWGSYDLDGTWLPNPHLSMTADEQRADNLKRGWPCP